LQRAFHEAPSGSEYVVPRARGGRNLRRYAEQTIKKAGVPLWPKLFVNCRSSRETELLAVYPAHVVFAWLGHTAKVAQQHYLQVTDADYDRAASNPAHYPAQSPAVRSHPTPSDLQETRGKTRTSRVRATNQIPPAGIEFSSARRKKASSADLPGTLPGTVADEGDVAELVRVLSSLTPEQRSALLALVRGLDAPAT
jgi:hypothetical protein